MPWLLSLGVCTLSALPHSLYFSCSFELWRKFFLCDIHLLAEHGSWKNCGDGRWLGSVSVLIFAHQSLFDFYYFAGLCSMIFSIWNVKNTSWDWVEFNKMILFYCTNLTWKTHLYLWKLRRKQKLIHATGYNIQPKQVPLDQLMWKWWRRRVTSLQGLLHDLPYTFPNKGGKNLIV